MNAFNLLQELKKAHSLNFLALVVIGLVVGACKPVSRTDNGVNKDIHGFQTDPAIGQAEEPIELIPQPTKVEDYAGADSCKECHAEAHESWSRSYHRTMTQLPVAGAVKADFDQVTLTNRGVRYELSRRGDEYWVRSQTFSQSGQESQTTQIEEYPLGLVTGSHHMQVYWVPNGLGNCQIGFPFSWLIPEKRWVPRNSTFIRPPQLEHRPEVWNNVCSRCHGTGTQPNYDKINKVWGTKVADLGISCEACHGPGERHVLEQRDLKRRGLKPDPTQPMASIQHPGKMDPLRGSQVCGYCHSMKWWDHKEGWPERGFSYRPGDDIEKSTPIIRARELDKQPWLRGVLSRNPDLLADFFWSDGMIRVSGREYNGLIESPCYKGGQFSCMSCHSMHGGDPNDQLSKHRTGNASCTVCHAKYNDATALSRHTFHQPGSTGSECYNCHMPHTTYGVLSAIRSHEISSPTVKSQLESGRPNACNLCHLDKSLEWTSKKLHEWYRQPIAVGLSEEEQTVSDSVRLALTGDAGQRALLAWHFGWDSAVATSSAKAWSVPILATLLDDPYAAVRCLAERSMKRLGVAPPAGYDYTIPIHERPAVHGELVAKWSQESSFEQGKIGNGSTLVQANDPDGTANRLRSFLARRNDRPVRLRE